MTFSQRTHAISQLGFTPRQSAFLTIVLLHAGVCLPRQYTAFSRIAFGQTTRDFFSHLTTLRYATAHRCWRRGGTLYHVHHKALYRAIGDPDNRHRRRITLPRAAERLMLLDIVLQHHDVQWLGTERDKVDFFTRERGLRPADLPSLTFGDSENNTTRYFTDKLPIGRGPRFEEVVFAYLVTEPSPDPLRRFIAAHTPLLHRLRTWTLLLVFPRHLATYQHKFERIAAEIFAPPLRPAVVDEFRWYCHTRRANDHGNTPVAASDRLRYLKARQAFGALRFYNVYRTWLDAGDASLNYLMSPLMTDAGDRGDARIVSDVLPNRYLGLERTVGTA